MEKVCKIGQVVQRFNDVLYSVRMSPRSSPIIVHIDRLRHFEGEPPEHGKTAASRTLPVRPADSIRPSVPLTDSMRPSDGMQLSAPPSDSMQSSVSTRPSVSRPTSSAAHGSCFPGVKQLRCASAAVTQPDKPFVKGIGNINCRRDAGSLHTDGEKENSATIADPVKLNRRDIRKPARFRRLAVNDMDYESVQPVGGASKRVRRPRTKAEKLRRREVNSGPFSRPYCTRPPFQHRSGFRRHTVLTHHMHWSWSGAIRPFADVAKGIMSHLQSYKVVHTVS
jgi:hypothetical protein